MAPAPTVPCLLARWALLCPFRQLPAVTTHVRAVWGLALGSLSCNVTCTQQSVLFCYMQPLLQKMLPAPAVQ